MNFKIRKIRILSLWFTHVRGRHSPPCDWYQFVAIWNARCYSIMLSERHVRAMSLEGAASKHDSSVSLAIASLTGHTGAVCVHDRYSLTAYWICMRENEKSVLQSLGNWSRMTWKLDDVNHYVRLRHTTTTCWVILTVYSTVCQSIGAIQRSQAFNTPCA